MHNILITGATGLLGSSLVPHLRKCGHNIYTHGLAAQADVMFNLSDKVKTFQALDEMRPEMIINLVSLTDVELCEEQVNFAYLANTRSVENLVNWIALSGTDCHLVQISSDHVYDGVGLHMEENVSVFGGFTKNMWNDDGKTSGDMNTYIFSLIPRYNMYKIKDTNSKVGPCYFNSNKDNKNPRGLGKI